MKTYSTEERVIGTDFDGSPIYEKTYYSDDCKLTASTIIDDAITTSTVKRMVDIKEMFFQAYWSSELHFVNAANDTVVEHVRITSTGVQLVIGGVTVNKYRITIQYVKAD